MDSTWVNKTIALDKIPKVAGGMWITLLIVFILCYSMVRLGTSQGKFI